MRSYPPSWVAPRRRQSVRFRFALLYGVLFLVAGSALIGLTYGLVAHNLNSNVASKVLPRLQGNQLLKLCKQRVTPKASTSALKKCEVEFAAGARVGVKLGVDAQRRRALRELLEASIVGLVLSTITSSALGWFMAGRMLRPIRVITEAARRASHEHLGERLALSGPRDELRRLADTFDEMLDRLDRAFIGQRRFVANASHELRTPLTAMRTAIDVTLAKTTRTEEQLESMATRVRGSVDRAEALIEALLVLATSDRSLSDADRFDLATATEDALDSVATRVRALDLRITAALNSAEIVGDPVLVERVVANLLDNALRYNLAGGWLHVETGVTGGRSFCTVANSGPLIVESAVELMFEPFFRGGGRLGEEGAGLGLSIVRSVCLAHGGSADARSRPEGGLEVTASFPEAPPDTVPPTAFT